VPRRGVGGRPPREAVGGVKPFELGPNQISRFYRGGARIAAFRGLPPSGDDAPEDWVASTTTVYGEDELGRSRVEEGVRLLDLFAADPAAFFEPEHLAAYGPEPAVLIKLLDAGERLPLHLHPDRAFAAAHLGAPHGKTEAWVILEAEPGATVHVGFAREVGADELAELVAAQDLTRFTEIMNRLPVQPGDAIYVPAGLPHVIGAGILLLELQEPSDLSLLLEWEGAMSQEQAFLGLSRELALTAVTRSAVDPSALSASRGKMLFLGEADRFFRAELVAGGDRLDPAFSVLVVTAGEGELRSDVEQPLRLARGSTVLVPFAAGAVGLAGSLRAIRCRPPTP
jgi:mannose-6-phosphate isomerase